LRICEIQVKPNHALSMQAEASVSPMDGSKVKFCADLKVKDASMFSGAPGAEEQWPRVLAFCDKDIPMEYDSFEDYPDISKDKKCINVNFQILNCLTAGYTRTPYANDGTRTNVDKNAKPLSEISKYPELGEEFNKISCYPWTMVQGCPKDKDERKEEEDLIWDIKPGMVLHFSFWRDSMRGSPDMSKVKPAMCPAGVSFIPAFTVVELTVSIKGWSTIEDGEEITLSNGKVKKMTIKDVCAVKKKYGLGLTGISISRGSVYSCLSMIDAVLPSTAIAQSSQQHQFAEQYGSIANVIQTQQAPFLVKDINGDTSFSIDDENGLIKLSNWAAGVEESIDITVASLLYYTNCYTIAEAFSLLQLACAAGCLTMLCVYNRYRVNRKDTNPIHSVYYGIPIISTTKLLQGINVGGTDMFVEHTDPMYWKFDATFTITGANDRVYKPVILITKDPLYDIEVPTGGATGGDLRCLDFILSGTNCNLKKAYFITFSDPLDESVIWRGFINLSKPSLMLSSSCGNVLGKGARLIRKRWAGGECDDVLPPFNPFGAAKAVDATVTSETSTTPDVADVKKVKKPKKSSD
jgi:hypothetical protein